MNKKDEEVPLNEFRINEVDGKTIVAKDNYQAVELYNKACASESCMITWPEDDKIKSVIIHGSVFNSKVVSGDLIIGTLKEKSAAIEVPEELDEILGAVMESIFQAHSEKPKPKGKKSAPMMDEGGMGDMMGGMGGMF